MLVKARKWSPPAEQVGTTAARPGSGRTVTLVRWGQMGDLEDAPLSAFRTTTKTAVNKLH